jgi:hypothetical protein
MYSMPKYPARGSKTLGWKLHERVAFAHGDRFRHRHDLSHELPGRLAGECQRGFNFCVLRKVLRVWKIERAASCIELVLALLSSLQRIGDPVDVAQIKPGRVNQNASAFFSGDIKAPQSRFGEGVSDGKTFVRVVAGGAKVVVRRYQ